MDLKLILLLCLIDLSLQGCEYEEATRLQKKYKRCVNENAKGSFSWMATDQADSAFVCSHLTQVRLFFKKELPNILSTNVFRYLTNAIRCLKVALAENKWKK